jgi:hypothetical protein
MRDDTPYPLSGRGQASEGGILTETALTEAMNGGARPGEATNGTLESIPLARRGGPKQLLPGSWVGRTLKVEYVDGYGAGAEATGACLDLYPFGIVLNLSGQRAAVSWDALRVVTLISD